MPAASKAKRKRPSTTNDIQGQDPSTSTTWVYLNNLDNVDERVHNFRFLPAKQPGVHADLNETSTPYDCFVTLFDEEVQVKLMNAINEYAKTKLMINTPFQKDSRYKKWCPLDRYQLLKYLAVLIAMGIDRRPCIDDYWRLDGIYYTPWYHQIFSRDRFKLIHCSMLHAASEEEEQSKKDKIEPFLNLLVKKFQDAFYLEQSLSIDEMVVKWKGRSKYKMYNPSKPEKYHIKTFGLCDSLTGYTVNLLIYFGKDTSYNLKDSGQSEKVFEVLLQPLGTGHIIFADRYYTTSSLINYLTARKMYYTGTLMSNRKGFPQEIKTSELKHQETKYFRNNDNGVLVCMWQDKKARKPVVAVSTYSKKEDANFNNKRGVAKVKPMMIHDYNQSMNRCDRMDQMLSYYNMFGRKTVKWWKQLFVWTVEVSQVNAYILYCMTREQDARHVPLLSFKHALIESLISKAEQYKPKDYIGHFISKPTARAPTAIREPHIVTWSEADRNCVYCSTPQLRKRTRFRCITCEVHLHPKDCFGQFHTK